MDGSNFVKPFVKWAGGKGQLLSEIDKFLPFANPAVKKYAEPFVGGGAVLFHIIDRYEPSEIYISDINAELINAYEMIRSNVESVIDNLKILQFEYISLDDEGRKKYYFAKRELFNSVRLNRSKKDNIEKASLMIFLNKTCFNGLYRVNSKGVFNVPAGRYKNPIICDEQNLRNIALKLRKVNIVCGSYEQSEKFIDKHTFVYFDPPYRPLTKNASFTAYSENGFDDNEQKELANYFRNVSEKKAFCLLSNSDPKNIDENDNFFDELYKGYKIERVSAKRMINSKGNARGNISELLITNIA